MMEFIKDNPWILIPPIIALISGLIVLINKLIEKFDKHITMSRLLSMDRDDAKFIDNSKLLNQKQQDKPTKVYKLPNNKDSA